ncbi:helix-turn-helix domain-containing protein [Prosthecobacter sp. SYSU 5D2]
MIGRIYALLYLTPTPLALEEIAARLAVSKASASSLVRQLAAWHAVRQIWIPGDRRDFYEAETDFSIIVKEGLMPGIRKKLHSAGVQIEHTLAADLDAKSPATASSSASEIPALTHAEQTELRRRLKSAQTLHRRIDRLLGSKLLSRFL